MLEPVLSCTPVLPNSLVDRLNTSDHEEEVEEEEKNEAELTLKITVKAMVNDGLIMINLKSMRGCDAAAQLGHSG